MNDTNFYISLIIATIIFGITTGSTVFSGAIGPVQKKPVPPVTVQRIFNRPSNSPYKDELSIGYVSSPGTGQESVSLYINDTTGSDIVVTGWKVRSLESGKELVIKNTATLPYNISQPLNLPRVTPAGTLIRMNSCAAYIGQDANIYNSCVATYARTKNFLTAEWRLYSGPGKTLWQSQRENLELLDESGRLVSEYGYDLSGNVR